MLAAMRLVGLLAAATLLVAAGEARAQCAGAPLVFKHTPSVDGARASRAEMEAALGACGHTATLQDGLETVTAANPPALFGGAVPAAYTGSCASLPTAILASASTDLLGDRALACNAAGASVTLDFGPDGVAGFGFYSFDAEQEVSVELLSADGSVLATFAAFSPLELATGKFAHAFWGVQARDLDVRFVRVARTGTASDAWFLDGLVAVRPSSCATVCQNGGTDPDCDGVCTGCDNNFSGDLCDVCATACENGGADADCDGVCTGCLNNFSGDLCNVCSTACENGGVDADCDGVCTGCDNNFSGDLCNECSTACQNGGVDSDCDGVCESCDNNFSGDLCDVCSTVCQNGGTDADCDGVCEGCSGMFGGDLCDVCTTACENGGTDPDCDGVCEGCDNNFSGDLCNECSTACDRDVDCDGVCDLMCEGGREPSADGTTCVCPDGTTDTDRGCVTAPAGCSAQAGGDPADPHSAVSDGLCVGIVWNECS